MLSECLSSGHKATLIGNEKHEVCSMGSRADQSAVCGEASGLSTVFFFFTYAKFDCFQCKLGVQGSRAAPHSAEHMKALGAIFDKLQITSS
jgi:hypothetical protein